MGEAVQGPGNALLRDQAAPRPATRSRKRLLRPLLFALLPVALVAGFYEYVTGGRVMATENAYVHADIVTVTDDISGIVTSVEVHDNQSVAAGDVLFRLDDLPFRLAFQRAQAQVGLVGTNLDAMRASYRDMQAQIQQTQVDIDFYAREAERQQQLLAHSVSSQATFDQAQRNLLGARQKIASLNEQLAAIAANLAGGPDVPNEKNPRMIDAVAARDEAARQLAHTIVRAPIAGVATNVPSLQPGQYLAAATGAFSIVSTDHVWIEANPKETELTWVRPGQPVTITVDTYPDQEWQGTVQSIMPAAASSFSVLPAQNTSGNWVKVVQRIAMRIAVDDTHGKPPLRAGMSVVASVDTGHARGLPGFLAGWFGPRHG